MIQYLIRLIFNSFKRIKTGLLLSLLSGLFFFMQQKALAVAAGRLHVLVFLTDSTQQKIYSARQKYAVSAQQKDIDTLLSYVDSLHIYPYGRIKKKRLLKAAKKLKQKNEHVLTRLEFFAEAEALLAKLQDSHTYITLPYADWENQAKTAFPYLVQLSAKKPYILVQVNLGDKQGNLPIWSEIMRINNIKSQRIVKKIAVMSSGYTKAAKLAAAEDWFNVYFGLLFLEQSVSKPQEYHIKYRYRKKKYEQLVYGISPKLFEQRRQESLNTALFDDNLQENISIVATQPYSICYIPEHQTAVIEIEYFQPSAQFKYFIDKAFYDIKQRGIQNLVIDLRKNKGGLDSAALHVLQYIAHKPYHLYEKMATKFSAWQREQEILLARSKTTTYWLGNVLSEDSLTRAIIPIVPDSASLDSVQHRVVNLPQTDSVASLVLVQDSILEQTFAKIPLANNIAWFAGKVYVLSSAKNIGTATDFLQAVRQTGMAEIIGQKSADWRVHAGGEIAVTLPETGLLVNIPTKSFFTIGASKRQYKAVKPHYFVWPHQALDFALHQIIKKGNNTLLNKPNSL